MYRTVTNIGSEADIPATPAEDNPYFTLDQLQAIQAYYNENGYVVVRGLVPKDQCDAANRAFDAECLPSKKYIYRQTTANPERNQFTDHGFVLNSLLNIQSVNPRHFPLFRNAGVEVLTGKGLQTVCGALFHQPGKIVQSMYFHGNPSTAPHQDTYYLDSEEIGAMTAVWIATEDIQPGAGRFFVCPTSHRIDMHKNGGDFDIAYNQARYQQLVADTIRNHQLRFAAPALAKGDALFWAAKTIHGSLPTTQPQFSRRSITGHFIPESHQFLQFQSRIKPLRYDTVNGVKISRPKDQATLKNRAILFVETTFPKSFQFLKRTAIKILLQ